MSSIRVLVVGPEWLGGWTESTARALKELGCTVDIFYYLRPGFVQQVSQWRKVFARALRIKGSETPLWFRSFYWRWSGLRIGNSLIQTARLFRPDLVLTLKGELLQPETLAEVKNITGAAIATWWVDNPFAFQMQEGFGNVTRCLPVYDCVFIFDRNYLAKLVEQKVKRAEFLPCTVDLSLFYPRALVPQEEEAIYAASVSFVGTYFDNRGDVIRELLGRKGLRVWGPGWQKFINGRTGYYREAFVDQWLTQNAVSKIYSSSSINLNIHHLQSQLGGLNNRAFEIPATGGFQLTDYVSGMEELLEPDREVAVYKDLRELPELVGHYLNDQETRKRIAKAGYERVLGQHTYRHRMKTLLNAL